MKKQLFILLTFVTTFVLNGQSNLVYNQTLYLNISENSVTVPENKTWKIVSSNGAFFRIDGAKFDMYHEDTGAVRNMPTWVPSGKTIDAGTQGGVFLSILEFNIVPISSTPNNSTATNSFGNLVPTSDPNSSIPSIFTSPQTFTSSATWTLPPGVTNICIEAWGRGGDGGNSDTNENIYKKGGGGGGGAYGYDCFSVAPGTVLNITFNDEGSSVNNLIFAARGQDGNNASAGTDGDGGLAGTSTAAYNISGTNGNTGSPAEGQGGSGGNGGNGGNAINGCANANDGEFPGGGGGGGYGYPTCSAGQVYNPRYGGDGGGGQIKIYF